MKFSGKNPLYHILLTCPIYKYKESSDYNDSSGKKKIMFLGLDIKQADGENLFEMTLNPGPADPGYALPLQTV